MHKRIGDLLVERGLITPLELDRALKAQLIFGGHLGTCLIELGFLGERSLGLTLSDLHGLRYADPERLGAIPEDIVARLPWKLADRYKAVPIGYEDPTLEVAVVDPKNVDRMSRLSGYRIAPFITPEFRIHEALEMYYGIRRSPRFVLLCDRLSRGERQRDAAAEGDDPPASDGERERDDAIGVAEAATQADLGAEYGYGKCWRDVADELFRLDEPDDHDAPPVQSAADLDAPDSVFRLMSRAQDRDELARVVLDHAAGYMSRVLLLSVRSDIAAPWEWRGIDLPRHQASGLRFSITGGSIFSLMLGDGIYRGPVPDRQHCRWIYDALQIEVPREVLLLPVYLNDRLVTILYGDGGPAGAVRGETEDHLILTRRLGLALNMLVLKTKICADT